LVYIKEYLDQWAVPASPMELL